MKIGLGVVLCVGLVLWGAAGQAETFYKYRDGTTGREVFVNRLDQIPRKYRSQAKVVMDVADRPKVDGYDETTTNSDTSAPKPTAPNALAEPLRNASVDLRQASRGRNLWKDGPAIASAMVDAKLAKAGTNPLTDEERAKLTGLLMTVLVLSVVAGAFAMIAWIVMIVVAVRDGHPWWGLFIFLVSTLAYVYLFIHIERGRRWFKTICALGLVSPALAGLFGAWRFYGWFHAIIQARGGHV